MRVIQLLSFRINDTDFFYTDAGSNYTYWGDEYIAGVWEGVDEFEQRIAPSINEHSIKLADPELIITISAYAGKWQWQPLTVRWLIVNEDGSIEDNFLVMQGAITEPVSNETDTEREVTLRVQENHTLELVTGHRTNNASQHQIDPTDNCFEMLPFLDGVKLPWGKEGNGVVYVPNSGGNGGNDNYNNNDWGFIRRPRYGSPDLEP